ncbi:MAG: hypothetical protein ACE5HC_10715 [Candidatus Binatia bacterium]
MRFQPRILFTLCVIIVAACAVYTARDWPLGTRLFPWAVGIPVLALSLVQILLECYHAFRPGKETHVETGDLQVDWSISTSLVARRAANFFGWLLGLFFGIWIFGFFIAIPSFGFLYLKLQAKEGWLMSSALTLGVFVFFIGLFDQIIHVLWPSPLLPLPEALLKNLLPFLD